MTRADILTLVTVGTPPQLQTVLLDTGSSDLYFDASTSQACETSGAHSCVGGEFTPGKSSTYKVLEPAPAFNNTYGDGSTANGPYSTDTVCISDECIDNVQFGLAQNVISTVGHALSLMGVGYSANEGAHREYPNIPEVLVDAGIINSRLYSLYLNDASATGSILFGGIDTSKYTGTLQTFNILPNLYDQTPSGEPLTAQFVTTITALSTNVNGRTRNIWSGGSASIGAYRNNDAAIPVLMDSGTSFFHIPSQYYEGIVRQFSYVDPRHGITSCANRDLGDSITLTIGGMQKITVDAREFILPYYDPVTKKPVPWPNSQEMTCVFAIISDVAQPPGFWIAGDAVMRSMYIVFDLDNGQMSIAQAKLNATGSGSIKTVAAGPNGVKNAAGGAYRPAGYAQNYSVPSAVPASASYAVSTAKTTIGAATGTGAVPNDAQPSGGSGGGSSGASRMGFEWSTVCTLGFVGLIGVLGAGLMV